MLRKIKLPEPDCWAEWRATYAIVTGEMPMGFSQVQLPELDGGYSFLMPWLSLPLDTLPLQLGYLLAVTARRLGKLSARKVSALPAVRHSRVLSGGSRRATRRQTTVRWCFK